MESFVFRNSGGREFYRVDPRQLGTYFEKKHYGRAVARLDWNRDGRDDFVVTHVTEPLGLFTNATADPGNSISLKLRAVNSARDAIGTRAEVTVGDRRIVRQLMAGDGFESSNERKLIIGLGDATRVDSLEVRWPSGAVFTYPNIRLPASYTVIEGAPLLLDELE